MISTDSVLLKPGARMGKKKSDSAHIACIYDTFTVSTTATNETRCESVLSIPREIEKAAE